MRIGSDCAKAGAVAPTGRLAAMATAASRRRVIRLSCIVVSRRVQSRRRGPRFPADDESFPRAGSARQLSTPPGARARIAAGGSRGPERPANWRNRGLEAEVGIEPAYTALQAAA